MIPILNLSKEERVQTLFTNLMMKDAKMPTFSPQYNQIEPGELMGIVELIEDRVYYISDSPSFEYQGSNYTSESVRLNTIHDAKNLMYAHPKEFFVIYTLQVNPMVISNAPGVSQPKSYHLRGRFFSDNARIREKIINQILDEE